MNAAKRSDPSTATSSTRRASRSPAPCRQERLETGALAGAPLLRVGHEDPDEDVEVPDGPEARPDVPELTTISPHLAALEPVAEHPPGGTHPARGDPHRVDVLGILARDDAGHARQHLRQVEAQDLAAGLRPRIVGAECPGTAHGRACDGDDGRQRHRIVLRRSGDIRLGRGAHTGRTVASAPRHRTPSLGCESPDRAARALGQVRWVPQPSAGGRVPGGHGGRLDGGGGLVVHRGGLDDLRVRDLGLHRDRPR